MGHFEKLVVLTILFLSAVVLAVALNDQEAEPGDPLAAAGFDRDGAQALTPSAGERSTLSGPLAPGRAGPFDAGDAGDAGAAAGDAGAPLLDASLASAPRAERGPGRGALEPSAERSSAEPLPASGAAALRSDEGPRERILRSEVGLERAAGMEEFRVYRVASGDTWSGLAERFYGDGRFMTLLRSANEELDVLNESDSILVPVFDFTREAGSREPYRPREVPAAGAKTATAAAPGGVYVVQDGDNLTGISQKVYGTIKRWEDIYRANRDVLQDPDWLQVGMKLKLPE